MKAEHRVEECFKRAKSESGLVNYQVRNWRGWHHHQTLAWLAAWFLNQEMRKKKNQAPALTTPQMRQLNASVIEVHLNASNSLVQSRRSTRWLQREETARFSRYRLRKIMPRLKNNLRLQRKQ